MTLHDLLASRGYRTRRPEVLALEAMLARPPRDGAHALLVEGPPGAGKSALASALSAALGAPLVVCQAHAWLDDQELYRGVDVGAAVAGDAERVHQPGVLARTAELAESHRVVVLLLDELDKAAERAEALLLDWLQTGRVPVRPGEHLVTRLDRVIVIATSNGERDHSDALLRRMRRLRMEPLPLETQLEILRSHSDAPPGVVTLAWRAAREVAESEGNASLSLQEGERLLAELELAESVSDVRESLAGWAARTSAGREAALRSQLATAVWAELCAARRAA